MIDMDQRAVWARDIANVLCESWGWQPDEPEALQLGSNIAMNLELLVANTRTSPEALLQGLLPMGAVTSEKKAAPKKLFVLQESEAHD